MVLWTASGASYLSEPDGQSRAGDLFFLGPRTDQEGKPPTTTPTMNAVIYGLAKIINAVMSSALGSEVAAAFLATREAIPIRIVLEAMGHKQPPTSLQVDNTTAVGFCNDRIKHSHSKAIDMCFHWIKDRVKQGQFVIYWSSGITNPSNYVKKHHPASHHIEMRNLCYTTSSKHCRFTTTARV